MHPMKKTPWISRHDSRPKAKEKQRGQASRCLSVARRCCTNSVRGTGTAARPSPGFHATGGQGLRRGVPLWMEAIRSSRGHVRGTPTFSGLQPRHNQGISGAPLRHPRRQKMWPPTRSDVSSLEREINHRNKMARSARPKIAPPAKATNRKRALFKAGLSRHHTLNLCQTKLLSTTLGGQISHAKPTPHTRETSARFVGASSSHRLPC